MHHLHRPRQGWWVWDFRDRKVSEEAKVAERWAWWFGRRRRTDGHCSLDETAMVGLGEEKKKRMKKKVAERWPWWSGRKRRTYGHCWFGRNGHGGFGRKKKKKKKRMKKKEGDEADVRGERVFFKIIK
jgi:hypothetical protein